MQCIILNLISLPQSLLLVLPPIACYAASPCVHNSWRLTSTARHNLRSLPPHPLTHEGVPCGVQLSGRAWSCDEFDIWTEPREARRSPNRGSSCLSGGGLDDEQYFLFGGSLKFRYFKAYRSSAGICNAEAISCPTSCPDH